MYLVFETIEEFQQYAKDKSWQVSVEIDLNTLADRKFILKIHDVAVGHLQSQICRIGDESMQALSFKESELKKLDVLYRNSSLIEYLLKYKGVSDIQVKSNSLTFRYHDRYAVQRHCGKSVNDVELVDLTSGNACVMTMTHFTDIINKIDKAIEKFGSEDEYQIEIETI